MSEYWTEVHTRAVADARKAANLETRDKMIMVIAVQALIGFLFYVVFRRYNVAAGIIGAAVPFLLLPIWYLVKFSAVPAKLAAEARDVASARERELEAQLEAAQSKTKASIRSALTLVDARILNAVDDGQVDITTRMTPHQLANIEKCLGTPLADLYLRIVERSDPLLGSMFNNGSLGPTTAEAVQHRVKLHILDALRS